jgi:hypothetical protein
MMKNFFILSHSFAIFIFFDQLSAIVALTLKHNLFCATRKSKKPLWHGFLKIKERTAKGAKNAKKKQES